MQADVFNMSGLGDTKASPSKFVAGLPAGTRIKFEADLWSWVYIKQADSDAIKTLVETKEFTNVHVFALNQTMIIEATLTKYFERIEHVRNGLQQMVFQAMRLKPDVIGAVRINVSGIQSNATDSIPGQPATVATPYPPGSPDPNAKEPPKNEDWLVALLKGLGQGAGLSTPVVIGAGALLLFILVKD